MRKPLTSWIALTGLGCLSAAGAEKVTYDDHIFPIFEQSCLNCHNPDKQKGGLDLSSYSGAMRGGSGGKIAEPGDGAGSPLFTSVTHTGEYKMPPKGDKIPKAQSDLIRAWVDGGLLETKDSTAKKRRGPKIDLSVKVDPGGKPDGPPPMPENLSLEPVVVASRASAVADMAASPWAPLLAITGQKQILLYNTDTLQLVGVLPFEAGQPETLAFHPSGKYLLAGGGIGGKSGTTITWDITTGQELMRNGRAFDAVLGADLRPDLAAVATGGPSRLIKLYDTQSGDEVKSIKKHTDWITGLDYSPDGILLATADRNGGCWVWEAETGIEFHNLRGHQKGITTLRWRADSNLLATASEDGQVIFWEMNNGRQAKKITAHPGGVLAFDYARNGHFVTSGRDRKVKVWKPDFNLKKELPPFPELVVEVAFSHDGKRFFTADWNGRITAWDAETFGKVGELNANPPRIAARIAWLQKTLGELPAQIQAAQGKVDSAGQAVTAAKAAHQSAIQKRDEAKQRLARLTRETQKLQEEWNQLDQRRQKLVPVREKQKVQLAEARQKLTRQQAALNTANQKVRQLEASPLPKQVQAMTAELARLEAELVKTPDNPALQQKVAEQKQRLTGQQQQLAAHEQQLAAARAGRDQAQNATKAAEQQLTGADTTWKKSNGDWATIEERRKQISERRKQVNAALPGLRQAVPNLEKAVKPAQELITTKEQALPPLKAELDTLQKRQASLQQGLTFWKQAAAKEAARKAEEAKVQ